MSIFFFIFVVWVKPLSVGTSLPGRTLSDQIQNVHGNLECGARIGRLV